MYILLTGYAPFASEEEGDDLALFAQICAGAYDFDDELWGAVSDRWLRCWAGAGLPDPLPFV
jgi:hypothetical protein